jgi:hypothetical protein
MTRYLLLFGSYSLVLCGVPSLAKGWVCLLCMLLALASAVSLGSESLGTRDHILLSQIWDSQGHGGGIRPRLHTGLISLYIRTDFRYITSGRSQQKTPFSSNSCCYRGVFMSPLHRNGNSSFACVFVAARMCLPSRCPATVLHVSQYSREAQWRAYLGEIVARDGNCR